MVLALDVGNSEITIGVWDGTAWAEHWRISSRVDQPEFFYTARIRDFFLEAQISPAIVNRVIISSVVPSLTKKIARVAEGLFSPTPIVLNAEIYKRLPIAVLNPDEIGSDLVANALAAWTKYQAGCIVVDFGTALTFTTISKDGKILGVSIAPGLQTAIRSLSQNTAKLFEVPLEIPASSLGINTITAIQTGVLLGYDGLVRNVVANIRRELNDEYLAIATGGLSSVITSLTPFFYIVDKRLTLDGLRIIGELNDHNRSD